MTIVEVRRRTQRIEMVEGYRGRQNATPFKVIRLFILASANSKSSQNTLLMNIHLYYSIESYSIGRFGTLKLIPVEEDEEC